MGVGNGVAFLIRIETTCIGGLALCRLKLGLELRLGEPSPALISMVGNIIVG